MPNDEMRELWNSPTTQAWVDSPERYDGMLADLGRLVLDAAALQPGERVLDVGCGSGELALQAAQQVGAAGAVVGADISAALIANARGRADRAGADHVQFVEADVQVHDLPAGSYDAVVSRFGVMFFDDPVAAFANLHRATAPGGRLSFVAWQAAPLNEWVLTAILAMLPHVGMPELPPPGAPGPFAFADEDHLRGVVTGSGWSDVQLRAVETTVLVGGGGSVEETLAYYEQDAFGRLMLEKADDVQRAAAREALREVIAQKSTDEGLRLGAAVWLVTASSS
jgi:SAM-dependent methyltransferase